MTRSPEPAATGPERLFCFGLGYTALAFARSLMGDGWRVAGTCQSEARAAELAEQGIEAYPFDDDRPLDDPEAALAGATAILVSTPPGPAGDPVLTAAGGALAEAVAGLPTPRWLGYLSTTGVYGDRGGAWVDERTPPAPTTARGRRRAAAEAAWLDFGRRSGVPVHLFRLAGIYGPGRSPLDAVRAGTAKRIDKPGQIFSRIHVDDIVRVLRASLARPDPGAIYNVCDDEPAPPAEVVAYACALLGRAPPPLVPFDEARLSPMARSFYAENKRVSNRRIKDDLGVRLAYPDYRSGLDAILAAEGP